MLARLCYWDGDNVPHSRKPSTWVGKPQKRVQTHQDLHRQEPADSNHALTLGTVWWCLHQVKWGQRNHRTCQKNLARGGCRAPVLWLGMLPAWRWHQVSVAEDEGEHFTYTLRAFCSYLLRRTNENPGSARIPAVREDVPGEEDHLQRDYWRSNICLNQQEWLIDKVVEEISGRILQDGNLSFSRESDHHRRSVTERKSRWAFASRWRWRKIDVGVSKPTIPRAEGLNSSRECERDSMLISQCLVRSCRKRTNDESGRFFHPIAWIRRLFCIRMISSQDQK